VTGAAAPRRWLSVHVLDITRGSPGAGIELVLSRITGDESQTLSTQRSNDDGRTDAPLLDGDDLLAGVYEIRFAIGDYFGARVAPGAPGQRFLDVVPVRFGVDDRDVHVHIALLVSPWSYTTYRGS
jgi:5-hydroxyisourate hydrolase